MALPNPPSLVEYKSPHIGELRFLIFDAPNDNNLPSYLNEFKKYNVKHVVRVCDPTYNVASVESLGIKLYDWGFPDGSSPPSSVISKWCKLVKTVFSSGEDRPCIGVHCVAGLGRAPVLVAIALIEAGMDNFQATELVRKQRAGAINAAQLRFLKQYKPMAKNGNCIVS